MLQADLALAGVPYALDIPEGARYLDFHAMRHSFLSALAAAGDGPRELQELARHSDPRLTLGIYTHVRADALGVSVARLPIPGGEANPLAGMTRHELETAIVGLLTIVATLAGVDTPRTGASRDSPGPAGTIRPRGGNGRK